MNRLWLPHPFNEKSDFLNPLDPAIPIMPTPEHIAEIAAMSGETIEDTQAMMEDELTWPVFKNDTHQVALRWDDAALADSTPERRPDLTHLSIKALDRSPVHDWRVFQEIKNMLVGPDYEGIEIYPAESRVVDTANQYHLWVFGGRRKDALKNFGFGAGLKSYSNVGGAKQRRRGRSQ